MTLMAWDDSMNIGWEKIDAQHRKLMEVINELYDSIQSDRSDLVEDQFFEELVDYFTENFSTEEELMLLHDYPKSELHRNLHLDFTARLRGMNIKSSGNKEGIGVEFLSFLIEWLIRHDLSADRELVSFVLEKTAHS